MEYLSNGWLWLYVGAFLMFAELLTAGFVVFFFGLAACTVGVLNLVLGDWFSLTWQFAAFSFCSTIYLLLLRKWISGIFTGISVTSNTDFDNEEVGRLGKITEAVNPPMSGRVMIGDAEWTATADSPLPVGADVKVVAQNNLTMHVEAV